MVTGNPQNFRTTYCAPVQTVRKISVGVFRNWQKNCPLSLLFSTNSTYHLLSTTDYFRHLFGKCIDWTKATPAGPGPVANGFTDLASGSTPLAHGFLVPSVLHWDSPMYMVKSLMVQSQVHLGVKLARGTVTIIPLLEGGLGGQNMEIVQ